MALPSVKRSPRADPSAWLYKRFALDKKLFTVSRSFCTAASSSSTALEQVRCTLLCRSSRHFCCTRTTGADWFIRYLRVGIT